jgi:RNA polymerase sigma-70 factor (ECF subfamily)
MTSLEFSSQLLSLEQILLRFAYSYNLKRPDAKDLVQETFLRAWLNKERFVDNQKFKSWIMTIMRNAFIDNYRNSLRKITSSGLTNEITNINQNVPYSFENPDDEYSVLEINQKIEHLKDDLKIPFRMFISGYKYTEIADILNLRIGTVKNRIFLSRKRLVAELSA